MATRRRSSDLVADIMKEQRVPGLQFETGPAARPVRKAAQQPQLTGSQVLQAQVNQAARRSEEIEAKRYVRMFAPRKAAVAPVAPAARRSSFNEDQAMSQGLLDDDYADSLDF